MPFVLICFALAYQLLGSKIIPSVSSLFPPLSLASLGLNTLLSNILFQSQSIPPFLQLGFFLYSLIICSRL